MNKMRELRKQKGLTMKELGKMVGVAESTISLYETGKHEPDVTTLLRIAKILGVTTDELLGHESEQESIDDEVLALREQLRRDPAYRMLFSAASKATPEHIKAAAAMLKALEGDNDD